MPDKPSTGKHPCFASPAHCELLYQGRKVTGSAQRQAKRSFLQHGSLPLILDYPRMAAAFGVNEHLLRRSMISISEAAGHWVSFDSMCETFKHAFEHCFQVELLPFADCDFPICDFSDEIASQ